MEDFHCHGMKVRDSAKICNQHSAALEKKVLPTAGYHPSSACMSSGADWPKSTVSGKVFLLLNVNAIDLLSLIKLSGYFSLQNLDKKITIPPRLRKKPLSLFLIWCKTVVVVLPSL